MSKTTISDDIGIRLDTETINCNLYHNDISSNYMFIFNERLYEYQRYTCDNDPELVELDGEIYAKYDDYLLRPIEYVMHELDISLYSAMDPTIVFNIVVNRVCEINAIQQAFKGFNKDPEQYFDDVILHMHELKCYMRQLINHNEIDKFINLTLMVIKKKHYQYIHMWLKCICDSIFDKNVLQQMIDTIDANIDFSRAPHKNTLILDMKNMIEGIA